MADLRTVQWWGWFGEWYDVHFGGWTLGEKPPLIYRWFAKPAVSSSWSLTVPAVEPWSEVAASTPDWYAKAPQEVEETVDY